MKSILIMCAADPETDPRPNRMINYLKDRYSLTVLAGNKTRTMGVESIDISSLKLPPHIWDKTLLLLLGLLLVHLRLRSLAYPLWSYLRVPVTKLADSPELKAKLQRAFDLVISHDLSMLPLAFVIGKNSKVLLDAREFYPKLYEDRLRWRLIRQPINRYLCTEFLPRCDKVITISDGIANEYFKEFGIRPDVVMSYPAYHDLTPSPMKQGRIRMIHHGIVSASRRPEQMIEMMDHVDERFSLDLMLMSERSAYYDKLVTMSNARKNVKIIPPVPMKQVIPFTNSYDIGLFLCRPSTFNLKFTLPNKLFEFIQARLAVAIGPSIEMRRIVEKYDCGVVAADFEPQSLAEALNALTLEKVAYYKERANVAASELNVDANAQKVRAMISDLVGNDQ